MAASLNKTASGFDRLARIYDFLAGLVYGKALRKAQSCMLEKVEKGSRVLVVGGGTGWFLEALLREGNPAEVVYVELSGGMLKKSKERAAKYFPESLKKVIWHQGTIHDFTEDKGFDLVCTHCFLDLFEGEGLQNEVETINQMLNKDAEWYFSDFCYADKGVMKWVSRSLIKVMYLFFRWFCKIEAGKLGNFREAIASHGFSRKSQQHFFGGMIESIWYSRGSKK